MLNIVGVGAQTPDDAPSDQTDRAQPVMGSEVTKPPLDSDWGEPANPDPLTPFYEPNTAAGCPSPFCGHAGPADDGVHRTERTWYIGRAYSFNLLNIEFYDLGTKELHFSGQRQDIKNEWTGLAKLLANSEMLGFVEINRKFINMRNLSSIHTLGDNGASLTFRDGATLRVTTEDLNRLIDVTK